MSRILTILVPPRGGQSTRALIANIIKRTPDLMHQSQRGMLRD
jgi:hypothetical protein